jgi:bifunctional DNase/RNase
MFRPIQKPQRPLSHALIANSRTSFGHPVNNIPIVRKSKNANTKGITFSYDGSTCCWTWCTIATAAMRMSAAITWCGYRLA